MKVKPKIGCTFVVTKVWTDLKEGTVTFEEVIKGLEYKILITPNKLPDLRGSYFYFDIEGVELKSKQKFNKTFSRKILLLDELKRVPFKTSK